MTKSTFRSAMISVFIGIGTGFFFATQFFGVWDTTFEKGIFVLAGSVLFVSAILHLLMISNINETLLKLGNGDFVTILSSIFIVSAILVMVFPLPFRFTPDNFQTIVIQPIQDSTNGEEKSILVEEIKINGNPLILADHIPSAGWQSSQSSLTSKPGKSIPFVIQNKSELFKDIEVLFGKGPDYGSAIVRYGWRQERIDLFNNEIESQVLFKIPYSSSSFWIIAFLLSWWLTVCCLILALTIFFVRGEKLNVVLRSILQYRMSVSFWIIVSVLFWYSFSFVKNVFFDPSHVMQNGNFLPAIHPIGNDLKLILNASRSVLEGGSPYAGANKYPPLATVFFTPLTLVPFLDAFRILTVINYLFFGFITIGFPFFLSKGKNLPNFVWILFFTGLFSYGLLFELERGQFNLISIGLAFISILIFHFRPRWRLLAYALFCISVQLKIYPVFFILLLTDDWRNWKLTFTRWIGLGLANIALMFILGPEIMAHYFSATSRVVTSIGTNDWPGNHSINGFISYLMSIYNLSNDQFLALQIGLIGVVIVLSSICFYLSFKRKNILDPFLILVCTIIALIIPSLSNDYTLAYLVGPAAFFFMHVQKTLHKTESAKGTMWFWTAISAFALSSTYYSYLQKPLILQNQFPILFLLLICVTILSFLDFRTINKNEVA